MHISISYMLVHVVDAAYALELLTVDMWWIVTHGKENSIKIFLERQKNVNSL